MDGISSFTRHCWWWSRRRESDGGIYISLALICKNWKARKGLEHSTMVIGSMRPRRSFNFSKKWSVNKIWHRTRASGFASSWTTRQTYRKSWVRQNDHIQPKYLIFAVESFDFNLLGASKPQSLSRRVVPPVKVTLQPLDTGSPGPTEWYGSGGG
jgi:hypothetical protein